MSSGKKSCKACGPGYATPLDAFKNGEREKLLYTITVQPNKQEPHGDYLSTVDVDPNSPTYSQVIHRTFTNTPGDELHHTGWNACSSCHFVEEGAKFIPKRNKLVMPAINSDRIYVVDVASNPRKPEIIKVVDGDVLKKHNVTAPHTSHCLADGNVMISVLGDAEGNAKGDFILFNKDFECVGTWTKGKTALCGYDFWYQPKFDVMVASEWAAPKLFRAGWDNSYLNDVTQIGRRLNFYKWSTHELIQTVDLGFEGTTPLEIRFLHDPNQPQGFVGTALFSKVYHFKKKENSDEFDVKKVIDIPNKTVEGWPDKEMGGLMSDIVLSLDDKYLYINNWFHGDVRQYDVSDPENPKLVGQIFLGGAIQKDSNVKVTKDLELNEQPASRIIKGRKVVGGPQMMQLSLDGRRLYVSTSLYSPWDKQFYPEMAKAGGVIMQLDCDIVKGGLTVNENFLVDFGKEPYGPTLPHEMRYPGGDCTSDIWLAD